MAHEFTTANVFDQVLDQIGVAGDVLDWINTVVKELKAQHLADVATIEQLRQESNAVTIQQLRQQLAVANEERDRIQDRYNSLITLATPFIELLGGHVAVREAPLNEPAVEVVVEAVVEVVAEAPVEDVAELPVEVTVATPEVMEEPVAEVIVPEAEVVHVEEVVHDQVATIVEPAVDAIAEVVAEPAVEVVAPAPAPVTGRRFPKGVHQVALAQGDFTLGKVLVPDEWFAGKDEAFIAQRVANCYNNVMGIVNNNVVNREYAIMNFARGYNLIRQAGQHGYTIEKKNKRAKAVLITDPSVRQLDVSSLGLAYDGDGYLIPASQLPVTKSVRVR